MKEIKNILFRSSGVGVLASGLINNGLTEKQTEELKKLEVIKTTPIGLTEKQAAELNKIEALIAEGKATDKQKEKFGELSSKLKTLKTLTPKQEETLAKLKEKKEAPPTLSQGAKTFVKKVWLENEKGFQEIATSKYLEKGTTSEEAAINLISIVDSIFYVKNDKRITKGNLTGECDLNTLFEDGEVRIIDDIKCSWSPVTFMNAELSSLYEWQGVSYMYLYNADKFRLRYCLVDCPPELLETEFTKFRYINKLTAKYIADNDLVDQLEQGQVSNKYPKEQALVEQFYKNYIYSGSNYTAAERVKTFGLVRCAKKEAILLKAIELGLEYYKTISLNMIEE